MTNKRPQNSILVLATLGVYLGLVLAGATPQILAQAATTRLFDVKDEIEVKEDLDNKPDRTAEDFERAVDVYFDELNDFIGDLRKLQSIEKFTSARETFEFNRKSIHPCPANGTMAAGNSAPHIDRWLTPAVIEASRVTESISFIGSCVPYDGFEDRTLARKVSVDLKYDRLSLLYEVSITFASSEDATSNLRGFASAFDVFVGEYESQKVLHKVTSLTTSNEQILITTRLPRAGLDALLAKDAK